MLKRNEIGVGIALATAFWVAVIALNSDASAQYQICETTQNGHDRCATHDLLYVAFWYAGYVFNPNTITALATAAIAYFTWTIKRINDRQLAHSHQIERAYVSGGGAPEVEEHDLGTETTQSPMVGIGSRTRHLGIERRPTGNFVVCVNNYGKTPAELQWVGIGFCDVQNIPEAPTYNFVYRLDRVQPGDRGRPVFNAAIPKGMTVIYGRFYYLDIFGGRHSCGFINEIGIERNRSDPILAPTAYTEERNESEENWPRRPGPLRTPAPTT
jgi:hypothetical protein